MSRSLPVRGLSTAERALVAVAAMTLCLSVAGPPVAAQAPDAPPAGATPATSPASDTAPPISVFVNGDPVAFPNQPPVIQDGFVLVPLRGVFEKLGAGVQYAAPTKTVTAVRDTVTIVLRLGDPFAYVNGQQRPLSVVPEELNGATMVPLRFLSEALGARVVWNKETRVAQITTANPTATAAQPTTDQLPAPPGTGPVVGVLTGMQPDVPSLTLRVASGENDRLPLTADAILLVKSSDDGAETASPLSTLKEGDQITATRDDLGRATVLRLRTDERRGTVKSVDTAADGTAAITLTDGTSVPVDAGTPVASAGKAMALTDVQTGQDVIVRMDPTSGKGVGIGVVTPDDPNPVPPVKLQLASVTLGSGASDHVLRAGDKVVVTAVGTPHATGIVHVAGVEALQSIPMDEGPPGTYSGTIIVPDNIAAMNVRVQVYLSRGAESTEPVTANGGISLDAAPPKVESVSPADGATAGDIRPLVYGTLGDPGSGVDPGSIQIQFDGKDVTAQSQISADFFQYKPTTDLAAGPHSALVVVRDRAGNETKRSWTFTVAPVNPIRALTITPDDDVPLNVGDTLEVRLDASPGANVTFHVPGIILGQVMTDQGGGVYIGKYMVKAGDTVSHAPVVVTYTPSSGAPIQDTASSAVTLMAGPPVPPIIDQPQPGASVGKSVTVSGRARPYTTVHVKISYNGKVILLPSDGILVEEDLHTDIDGKWTTDKVDLKVAGSVTGITYTVVATTVGPGGQTSDPATIKFKK
jgi:hypothetical protein